MPHQLSQLLYASRWAGALLVLAVHATTMFIDPATVNAPDSIVSWTYWFFVSFELGHISVVGFFVMSGFLVGGAVIAQLRKPRPFLQHYFVARFTRIYMVLVPAVMLTAVLDLAGRTVFAGAGVYDIEFLKGRFDPRLIVTNLLNLQAVAADFYGTNGPLWSVGYEFWYYVIFPLLALPLARMYSRNARIAGFALGAALYVILSIPHKFYLTSFFVIWTLGAAATLPRRPLVRSKWLSLLLYVAVAFCLRLVVRGPMLERLPELQAVSDIASAVVFANLLLTLRFSAREGWRPLDLPIHKLLADFSYTLYAIHAPIIFFSRAGVNYALGQDWPARYGAWLQWTMLASIMALALAAAFGLSRLTEAKVDAARRVLHRLLSRFEKASIVETGRRAKAESDLEEARSLPGMANLETIGAGREPGT